MPFTSYTVVTPPACASAAPSPQEPVDEQQEPAAWGVSVSVVMAFSSSQAHVV
ncbi:hypothetical protein F750_2538 [Streptomyces sp. PAMC 26508]|nr:hypothetical protein F750_2538 [Streptomyces sp. PAMC 26508]